MEFRALTWHPARGVNFILGGGDVGKTTILDAVALLLSPVNSNTVLDTDYFGRDIDAGFSIEAVMSLPASTGIDHQTKPAWPWVWKAGQISIPDLEEVVEAQGETVYWLPAKGWTMWKRS